MKLDLLILGLVFYSIVIQTNKIKHKSIEIIECNYETI